MRVSDLGERKLIRRMSRIFGPPPGRGVLGIGDDCAVVEIPRGSSEVISTDAVADETHFLKSWITPTQLGRKAVAVALSDLAAMGARPVWCLVSLGLSADTEVATVERFCRGMKAEAESVGCSILGGNVCSTSKFWASLTVGGVVRKGGAVLRKGCRAGDRVYVTGKVGGAAAGLEILKRWMPLRRKKAQAWRSKPVSVRELAGRTDAAFEICIKRFLNPRAMLAQGQYLAGKLSPRPSAMIDLSDGLIGGLRELGAASGVGFRVWKDCVPIDEAAVEVAGKLGKDPWELLLAGGEDYELLFTVRPPKRRGEKALERGISKLGATWIGEVIGGGKKILLQDGKGGVSSPDRSGFEHF